VKIIRELNIVSKNFTKTPVKVALVYPSKYIVAITSLSYHLIYYMLNSLDYVVVEHSVYDEELGVLGDKTLESNMPLNKFDIIMYTVHYELDYSKIVLSLYNSKIPLYNTDRERPIVVIGGPPTTANPQPLSKIADVLIIGEAEEPLKTIVEEHLNSKSKREFLERISGKPGIYTPQVKCEVRRFWVKSLNLEGAYQPILHIIPMNKKFMPVYGPTYLLEASRGCPFKCRFCLLGFNFNPPRHRSLDVLKKLINKGVEANNASKVSLVSSSYFTHPKAKELLEYIIELKLKASIPSIRLDTLDQEALELMVKAGQRTLTIAPETGGEHLRFMLNKGVSNNEIIETARTAENVGFKNLKLYFIYGLPFESLDDVKSIVELVSEISRKTRFRGSSLRVTINPFIPKANTPLQWYPVEHVERLKSKRNLITRELRRLGARVEGYDPKLAVIQTLFSIGGEEATEILIEWSLSGAKYSKFRKLLSLNYEKFRYVFEGRSLDEDLPWSFIVNEDYKKFLKVERELFMRGQLSPACFKGCIRCGVCKEYEEI